MNRRVDDSLVAAAYYATAGSKISDVEQYTLGGGRTTLLVEIDTNGDGLADGDSGRIEVYNGRSDPAVTPPAARRWRFHLSLSASEDSAKLSVSRVAVQPR